MLIKCLPRLLLFLTEFSDSEASSALIERGARKQVLMEQTQRSDLGCLVDKPSLSELWLVKGDKITKIVAGPEVRHSGGLRMAIRG